MRISIRFGRAAALTFRAAVLTSAVLWVGCAHTPDSPTTGTLVGKVVHADGVGVADARVRIERTSTEVVTGPDGSFRFPHLHADTYHVEAISTLDHARFKESVRIHAGRVTEVELTLTYLPIEPEFYGVPVDSLVLDPFYKAALR